MKKCFFLFVSLLCFSPFTLKAQAQTYVDFYNQGVAAYQKLDYSGFLKATFKADSVRPNHYVLLYNLANAYVLNGELEKALETLDYRAHFYAQKDFVDDDDLKPLHDVEGWENLMTSIEDLNKSQKDVVSVFSIRKKGFHPEGILYHKKRNKILFTDVRTGFISSIDLNGQNLKHILSLKDLGYWSAFGLKVDPENTDHLWVTTAAIPNFDGYKEEDKGKSAILLIDLKTNSILERYEKINESSHFGDLIIDLGGTVYVTDSGENPTVYRLNRRTNQLEVFATHEKWWNLQGLAFSKTQDYIYVSDYITGIYKVDIDTREITPLLKYNEWLRGGDGIYVKEDRLIVLQNGTVPKRVASIQLDVDGLGIMETLYFPHKASKELQEPTLGTWVEDEFYYIANSPWGYYNENNQPKLDQWPEIYIFKLKNELIK